MEEKKRKRPIIKHVNTTELIQNLAKAMHAVQEVTNDWESVTSTIAEEFDAKRESISQGNPGIYLIQ